MGTVPGSMRMKKCTIAFYVAQFETCSRKEFSYSNDVPRASCRDRNEKWSPNLPSDADVKRHSRTVQILRQTSSTFDRTSRTRSALNGRAHGLLIA
jgi:hypothetical protein